MLLEYTVEFPPGQRAVECSIILSASAEVAVFALTSGCSAASPLCTFSSIQLLIISSNMSSSAAGCYWIFYGVPALVLVVVVAAAAVAVHVNVLFPLLQFQ